MGLAKGIEIHDGSGYERNHTSEGFTTICGYEGGRKALNERLLLHRGCTFR